MKDLVSEGKSVGGMTKMTFGNNAIGPNYMGMLGAKYQLSEDAWFGGLYGYSWRKISQDYKIGGGRRVTDSSIDLSKFTDPDEIAGTTTSPFNAEHLKQKPTSQLAKLEFGTKSQTVSLSYRDYQSELAGRSLKNQNYQINYNLHPEYSRWLDLNVLYALNQGKQQYKKGARINNKYLLDNLDIENKAETFNIANTFRIPLFSHTELETTFGFNRLKNRYFKNRHPAELNFNLENGETNEDNDAIGIGAVRKSLYTSTFQPDGEQRFNTFYWDNSLTHGIFVLDINANINLSRYKGTRFKYLPFYRQEIEEQIYQLNRQHAYNEANVLQEQLEKLEAQYCRYIPDPDDPEDEDLAEFECADKNISTESKGKHRLVNYSATLSAYIHDLFTPFVSYSKTHRVPNVKEMFFSTLGDYGVNTDLKPEQAKTVQIGFNGFKENIFTDNDKLGFKALIYRTRVKDHIFNVSRAAPAYVRGRTIYHKNYDEKVKMNGFELELNYDMGSFYANLAYAHQNNTQPISFTDASARVDTASNSGFNEQGFGASKISILPRDYASLELGTRWFEKKLQIGGVMKYYGKSRRASTKFTNILYPNSTIEKETLRRDETVPKQPMIFDFYVSYEPIKDLIIKLELQNAFDKKYTDPLDANNDSASQTIFNLDFGDKDISVFNNYARGRTAVLSATYKF
ncbi:TonB-dependent receptor domain-containing protein [Pasteurella bettyae]|uniref:TonB-dependent receptor domain-containing protein n=1 Tax=Pasteurella bettyae TaxID=752 RepID=UPI003D2D4070